MTLGDIINDHIAKLDKSNKRLYNKKVLELCHTGKFLVGLDEGYSITNVTEQPDFIIQNGANKAGLEHVILVNSHKKREGSIKDLFEKAEEVFAIDHPDIKVLINIFIKEKIPEIKKKQVNEIIPLINKVIFEFTRSKKLIENDFIDDLHFTNHNELHYAPNMGAWGPYVLTDEIVTKAIMKKDKLVSNYINKTGLNDQWLLIVIGSMGTSSYQMHKTPSLNFESNFKRICILEDFHGRVTQLK